MSSVGQAQENRNFPRLVKLNLRAGFAFFVFLESFPKKQGFGGLFVSKKDLKS